jgi:hypothetical protein
MKKVVISATVIAALGAGGTVDAAFASNPHSDQASTTLDACGYFIGTQTAAHSATAGSSTTEEGQWSGVLNNYSLTPVASLGDVHGAYRETTTTDANGNTTGIESFTSNAGKIEQTFTYGPGVVGGFNVTVTATRDLAFLTSDTNGGCYQGPVPRP